MQHYAKKILGIKNNELSHVQWIICRWVGDPWTIKSKMHTLCADIFTLGLILSLNNSLNIETKFCENMELWSLAKVGDTFLYKN
jgi:hypothetical protein